MNFLICDDHAIVRKGLKELLHEKFPSANFSEATNSGETLSIIASKQIDFVLMDISMPGRNGIDTLKELRAQGRKMPILILSMHSEEQYALRALKAGASGFINKESATDELVLAVNKILAGRKYLTERVAERLAASLGDLNGKQAHEALSDRELQVLELIASGKTVSDIAQELSLSINTISTYRARILEKLALNNNAELTRYAIDHQLI